MLEEHHHRPDLHPTGGLSKDERLEPRPQMFAEHRVLIRTSYCGSRSQVRRLVDVLTQYLNWVAEPLPATKPIFGEERLRRGHWSQGVSAAPGSGHFNSMREACAENRRAALRSSRFRARRRRVPQREAGRLARCHAPRPAQHGGGGQLVRDARALPRLEDAGANRQYRKPVCVRFPRCHRWPAVREFHVIEAGQPRCLLGPGSSSRLEFVSAREISYGR
jgi:hypothetical protein